MRELSIFIDVYLLSSEVNKKEKKYSEYVSKNYNGLPNLSDHAKELKHERSLQTQLDWLEESIKLLTNDNSEYSEYEFEEMIKSKSSVYKKDVIDASDRTLMNLFKIHNLAKEKLKQIEVKLESVIPTESKINSNISLLINKTDSKFKLLGMP